MESGKIFEQPTFNNLPDSGFSLADADDKTALAQARRDYANLSLSDISPIRRPKHSGVGNLDSLLDEEGAQHLAHVVQAIWKQESGSGKNARTSTDGARGGMQIMPATFKMYARAGEQIDDPDDNMRVGIRLIKDLGDKFGNDPARIAAGYFSGAGNVNAGKGDAWKRDRADGNGKRVSSYVADVMEKAADFYESGRKERPAAEQTPAPEAKQPEQKAVLPDLDKAPAWKDVLARPDFWELTPEERQTAKEAYFDYWIAPHAGGEAASLRIKFMAQPMDEPKRTWGEAATDTLAQLGEGVNTILGAVPNLVAPDSGVAQFFNDNADTWRGNQSLALKTKMAKADRAISEAGKDGMISQLAEAAGQYFTDPALAARFITTNLPSMIPGVGAAKLAQAAALARGASLAKAAGVATTAAGITNAALNAGGARGDAFEDIKQTLINQGMSAKEAEETALRDSRVSAAIGALTGYLSGKTGLEKNLVSQAGTRGALKSMVTGTAAELAGEINEEATPQLATNVLANQYDQRDITHNIGRTIVETAFGAGPGSVLSGVKAAQHSQPAQDAGVPNPDTNETGEVAQPAQPAQSPQTGAHPTSQVADNIVREAAAEAGVSTQDLLPEEPQQAAQTSPEQSAQPVQTLAPEEEARAAELYIKASDGTLNAEEAAELAGLEQRLAQEQSVEESTPNFTQEQPEAASAQESAPPQNVPATAQESAPESVQNVAEPTQQTQPMQQAQEAPAEAPAAQASPNQPTFASAAAAQGFIDQLDIGATHAVAQSGKRFIIRKKDAPNAGQSIPMGTPVTENNASARVPNGTQTQNAPESESVDSPAPTNFADRVLELVRTALSRRSGNKAFIDIAPVSDAVAARIKKNTGLDVSGYTHSLDESGVRHIFNQHGDEETERERGQVAVTEEDFARLQEVVASPDSIRPGNDANTVIFAKKFGNTWHYVQEVRTGRKKLAAKTLWKARSAQLETGAPAVAPTSGTYTRSASTAENTIAPTEADTQDAENKGNAPEGSAQPLSAMFADSVRQAEIARLQSAQTVRNTDGKPFGSEEEAAQYRQTNALDGTHKVQKVQTGYVLQKLPESKMPEKRTHAHTGQAKGEGAQTRLAQAKEKSPAGQSREQDIPDSSRPFTRDKNSIAQNSPQTKPRNEREAREMRARQSDEQQNNASGQQAASKREEKKPLEKKKSPGGLRVGEYPVNAQPVSVRDGIVHIADEPAYDYETGDKVRVRDGASDEEIAQALKDSGALTNKQKVFGLASAKKSADAPSMSRSAKTRAAYEARIDELFKGAKANPEGVKILDRSDMLDMFGMGDKPLKLAEGKVIAGQSNHPKMMAEVWKKIPEWVENPAMVFDSDTVAGRLVFIAPEKVRGNDVRIVIEPKQNGLEAHVLVNAYDKDNKSPYSRWARDRLLRYADIKNASRIDERFGLQLPDILRNPAFMPDAQIHGMGRGNTKALRRTKILTENNLKGYRKNNPESAQAESVAGARKVAEVKAHIDSITKNWKRAPEVIVARDMQDEAIPEAVRRHDTQMKKQGASGEAEGFIYQGKVYLVADQLGTLEDATRTLFHEALGHYGLKGVFGNSLDGILGQIVRTRLREVVAKAREYGLMPDNMPKDAPLAEQLKALGEKGRMTAAEEILAEMAQDHPELGFVKRSVAAIRQWLRGHVPGLSNIKLTDDEIIHSYILPARGWVKNGKRSAQTQIEPMYSRRQSDDEKARILQGEPVAKVSIEDVPAGGYADIARWASSIFARQGGKAVSPIIGEVVLNEQSARDSMAHGGANAAKKAAFGAVKDVIERGALVYQAKDGRVDSFYISAPVSISGKDNIVTVLTHRDPNTQRMYLHSVLLKENLLKPSVSAVDAKTSERSSATTSEGTYSVATGRADGKASGAQVAERLQALLSRDITPMYSRKQAVEAKKALEKMEPVVIGVDKAIESDDIAAARSRAKQLYKALKPVKTIDGRQVEFPISGFKETAQHAADRRVLLVIQKLGELIERAQPLWRDALNDPKRPNVVAFHNYGVKASFPSGEAFVRIVLREDNDGHVYYDNDATSVEAIDKTKAPVSQPDRKPNPGEGAEGLSKNRLAQWWDSVNTEEPQHSRSKATQQAYEKRINELFAGGKANLEGVRVLDRSDVLGLLGYEDKPIVLAEGKVKSGIINHPRITAQVWKKVPGWLENPAAVFKSETAEGLVFIAPELIAGRPVSVIVRPDAGHPNTLLAHVLLNAYERSANTPFMRWINNGLMQYADKKKFPAVFESASGRRLPSTALQNKPGMPKILTENSLVGYRKQQEAPRYARKKTERSAWDAPPTFMERMIYDYQDKHIHLKKIIQSLGEVYESFNTYLQEELYHGRVAARVHKFAQRELNVLLKDMALKGITQDALEGFLWARHAKERNAQIARINPDMPDGGSGLTSAEIADYFAGRDVKRGGEIYLAGMKLADRQRLEKLAARVDAMNAGTRQLLLQYGLETPETIKKWDETYKYYVPLHREDMDGVPAIGQGFSTKGSASKRAMGSTQRAENILAHIALQREAAITRGEKNRVALSLYGLALRNPQPDFWQIDKIPQKRIIGQDGTVKTINDPGYKNMPNVLMVRIGGQDRAIVFNEYNDRALQVAAALKNLDAEQLDNVTASIARVTRYISAINTQYNPVFGIVNLWRDTQAVVLNLSSTPIKGKRAEVLKNILPAMRAIWRAERPRLGADGKPILETDAWSKLYEEMQLAGGTTGYRDMFRTATERTDQLKRELAKNDRSKPRKTFDAVLNVLDAYNTAMENATRLAAYKAARDSKLSVDRSASVAKNITVNFNRKGRLTSKTGALYGFFNASVQGTARTYETLSSSAGRKIILGGVMVGVLQSLMAAGMDDDDWEAIPEFVKQRSLIIPTGNGEYVTWQYPLGFNALPNIGRITAETIFGKRSIGSALVDLLEATLDATNPLGSGTPLQIISPTVSDPIAALAENKNFAGSPIAKTDRSTLAPTPGHKRARDTSSHLSRGIAQGINWATGGTDYTPGLLSPTPDQIDYIFGSITGGLGRETNKLYQASEALLTGQSVPARKIPLISRFYGTTRDDMSITSQYWDNVQKLALLKNEIDGRKKDGIDNSILLKERPEARLLTEFNKSAQRISKLRSERHRIEFDEKMSEAERTERLRKLDVEIIDKMRDYNKRVSDAKTGKRSWSP